MIVMNNENNKPCDVRNVVATTGIRLASLDELIDKLEDEKDELTEEQILRLRKILLSVKIKGTSI